MCLIAFSWQRDTQHPLILVANRDEFYQRPTKPVGFWEDASNVLGGRDLEAGGSWMAINKNGRFATVTNYREVPVPIGLRSRGELVYRFVTGSESAIDYLRTVRNQADDWSGFNLLIMDATGLYYFSNRSKDNLIVDLPPGIYGLSNHLLDTPWPKLLRARDRLTQSLQYSDAPDPDSLIEVINDNDQCSDELLPNTGVSKELEKQLSSCFITGEDYGTRNTSVLMIDQFNQLQWVEQEYLPEGVTGKRLNFKLKLHQKQVKKEVVTE